MGEVLVTGATGGIGRAVLTALVEGGHRVLALGRDGARLRALPAAAVLVADLTRPEQLAETVRLPPRLDALVHCAGVSVAAIRPVAATEPAVWQQLLAVNTLAAAELTRLALPALRRSRGHVLFVNAGPGGRAGAAPNWSAFAASKAALRQLADALRVEEEPHGVRVTSVYPAGTDTEQLRQVRAASGREYDPQRMIRPQTLAAMVAWVLAAPPDAYVSDLAVLPRARD